MAGEDPAAGKNRAGGVLGSARRFTSTLVAVVQTRLQLLGNEIHEEVLRIQQLWVLAVIAVFFFALGVLLLTLLVIALVGDAHRALALGGFGALYMLIAIVLAMAVRKRSAARSHLFETSLNELKKDGQRLAQ